MRGHSVKVLFLMVIALFSPSLAQAMCTAQNTNVNFPTSVNVQRDTAIGTIIATVQTVTKITCDKNGANSVGDGSWGVYSSSANTDYGSSTLAGFRKTLIEGVGFQWKNLNSYPGTSQTMTDIAINDSDKNYRGIALEGTTTFTDTWALIKSGAMKSGTMSPPPITMNYRTAISHLEKGTLFSYNFNPVVINVLACSIINSSINVVLDPLNVKYLTGVGVTGGDKPFTIGLNCDADARINVSLTGIKSEDTTDSSVIAVNDTDSPNAAKGVGVQLLYDANPLKIGERIVLKTSTGGSEFPGNAFTARYYQTQNLVTPGEVNVTATLNLTYQ